ncbi:acyltransferase family protein [Granulicella arctica]|uniref:Peptidoglycan/LPS O-acetylase OafA/YrhL n=1 Tax=Granulicella arctica TaxID=940613 RepID=A0A7Y9PG28_9BACT|nr:acyltransferase [Granulicella arctica]NYF79268.1 peptidoglycan/LPS O-acetylase OafA/YrhL [Granulicella arctica]
MAIGRYTQPDSDILPQCVSIPKTQQPSPMPTNQKLSTRKPPLPALTGIRTLLALNIVFFHFTPPHMGYAYPFINNGFVFVGFFILLSGYVLSYNYMDRALTLSPRDFWTARFARLYPIYLLALIVSFQMLEAEWQVRSHAQFWQGILLTPILLQGWSPHLATFWNTVGWTLSCELILYAAFPWIIRTWTRRVPWFNTPARLITLFFSLWIIGLLPHSLYLLLNPDHLATPVNRYSYGFWLRALKYTPPSYICMFLAGITLGKLQLLWKLTHRQRLGIAALGLTAIGLFFYTSVARVPYILLHGGLLLPLFATLTIGLSGTNVIASIFSWRPLLLVGETTFCLYMLHFNSMNMLRDLKLWEHLHLAAFDPWISYATVLLFAFAAHHLVERPARKVILSRFLSKTPALSTPTPAIPESQLTLAQ